MTLVQYTIGEETFDLYAYEWQGVPKGEGKRRPSEGIISTYLLNDFPAVGDSIAGQRGTERCGGHTLT